METVIKVGFDKILTNITNPHVQYMKTALLLRANSECLKRSVGCIIVKWGKS